MDRDIRRRSLDALKKLNEFELQQFGDPETLTRINQYELAFRMQMAVPQVMDINQEPKRMQELYGAQPGAASFANNCLLARRLVERGVRYVQLYDWAGTRTAPVRRRHRHASAAEVQGNRPAHRGATRRSQSARHAR